MKETSKFSVILLLIMILNGITCLADSLDTREGQRYFTLRAEGAIDLIAKPDNIDKAIAHLTRAMDDAPNAEAAVLLLKAYEFKGARTDISKSDKVAIFEKGISFGKEMMEEYPEEVGIRYWYMANLGRWAQEVGMMKAARADVADQVREIATWVMTEDPYYDEAGAYRVLGSMHIELPRIPFVLSWPSDDEGLKLLAQAYALAPENYGNCLRYARALMDEGEDEKALEILETIEDASPRKHTHLEDLQNLKAAKELLADLR